MSGAGRLDPTPAATPAAAAQQIPALRRETHTHVHSLIRGYGLLLLSGAAFLLFGLMAFLVRGLAPLSVDLEITTLVQNATLAPVAGHATVPVYDDLLESISLPGFMPYILIINAAGFIALALRKLYAEAVFLAIAAGGAGVLVEVVKLLVARPRPTAANARIEFAISGYSFPSGHVAWYVCFFGFLFYLAWSLQRPGRRRNLVLLMSGLLVALIGVSRIYDGHHWASDALGGYGLGFGWLGLCIWAYRRWETWHLAHLHRLQQHARNVIISQSSGAAGPSEPSIPS